MATARRYLLIDGHSIIHAWPELRAQHLRGPQRHAARDMLLQRMRHYQDMTGEQVIVVFDGTQSRTTEEREPEGLQIFYADAGTTADTIIERLVAKYGKEHDMRAATADGMVRETVNAFGGDWISPETLRTLCDAAEAEMRRRIAKR
jgi:predicted RNA-binding protein with PIN domain